jgi:hypothetical protein
MTPTNHTDLNRDLEALRASVSMDDTRGIDRPRPASIPNFNELRYLDTRPIQHMTATWGN